MTKEEKRIYNRERRQREVAPGISRLKCDNLLAKFRLTLDDYLEMLEKQNHKCAICGNKEVGLYKKDTPRLLSVDHCHKTGRVRALLCGTCNNGLGCFKDNPELIMLAAKYLLKQNEERE